MSGHWAVEVQRGPEGEQDYAWVKSPDGELICVVKTHHAHLFAAAPDMLKALTEIQELLADWPTLRALSALGAEKATANKLTAREIVATAIAKAEGR